MSESTGTPIGERLQGVRKRRGLSQRELASASGVSLSLIRKLEQGAVMDTRMETARKLAVALRVSTSSLLDRDAVRPGRATTDQWAVVRAVLDAPPAAVIDEEPTTDGVAAALASAEPLTGHPGVGTINLGSLAALLPPLLRDADALTGTGRQTRAVQVRALQLTGWLLTQTHQYQAASDALDRALDMATDRLDGAATVNTRCWLLVRQGRFAEARALATEWADDTEPRMSRATPAELSAWGWMLLRVANASLLDNRPGEAAHALKLARSASVAMGQEGFAGVDRLRTFGPATVTQHMIEHANVTDQPDRAIALTGKMPPARLTASNRGRHKLSVADAYTRVGDYDSAVAILQGLRENQPEWLVQQRYARDIVSKMIGKRRTLTPVMRELADAIGVPV
jgi:transcriptional regulator with XRE-family HTH domain